MARRVSEPEAAAVRDELKRAYSSRWHPENTWWNGCGITDLPNGDAATILFVRDPQDVARFPHPFFVGRVRVLVQPVGDIVASSDARGNVGIGASPAGQSDGFQSVPRHPFEDVDKGPQVIGQVVLFSLGLANSFFIWKAVERLKTEPRRG